MEKAEYTVEPGKQELTVTREFDAPRELVFKAFTDPGLFARWWGPRQYTNVMEKFEVKPGGMWRVVQKGQDGGEHAFRGVHHDVVAPERIVATFEYEGVPGHVLLQSITLEDKGGRTRLVAHQVFQSVGDRDGMVASGMKEGADDSYERLDDLLKELKAGKA
jgi:uncharacterized protein YndB with AHSA1/START domain